MMIDQWPKSQRQAASQLKQLGCDRGFFHRNRLLIYGYLIIL